MGGDRRHEIVAVVVVVLAVGEEQPPALGGVTAREEAALGRGRDDPGGDCDQIRIGLAKLGLEVVAAWIGRGASGSVGVCVGRVWGDPRATLGEGKNDQVRG